MLRFLSLFCALDAVQGHTWNWTRVEIAGEKPTPREGHASAAVDGKLFVFGGCYLDVKCFNDLFVYNPTSFIWGNVPLSGSAPEPRAGLSMTLVGQDLIIFGGANLQRSFNDVYKLSLVDRKYLEGVPTNGGVRPPVRSNHAAAGHRTRVFMFGGYSPDDEYLNDLWLLDLAYDEGNWQQDGFPMRWAKPVVSGDIPLPRESHAMTLLNGRMYVVGGYTSEGLVQQDLHVLDLHSMVWNKAVEQHPFPFMRQGATLTHHGQELVLVAGCDPSQRACYNDVWSLDAIGLTWSLKSTDRITLTGREGQTSDFIGSKLIVFGGCALSEMCFNDITVLDTGDSCPSVNGVKCGGNGQCIEDACVCNPNFVGHDCNDDAPCDCSGHGSCSSQGVCSCYNNFEGATCSEMKAASDKGDKKEEKKTEFLQDAVGAGCPLSCCSRGRCDDGACVCIGGWHGTSCNVDTTTWALIKANNANKSQALLTEASQKRMQAVQASKLAEFLETTGPAGDGQYVEKRASLEEQVRLLTDEAANLQREAAFLVDSNPIDWKTLPGGAASEQSCSSVNSALYTSPNDITLAASSRTQLTKANGTALLATAVMDGMVSFIPAQHAQRPPTLEDFGIVQESVKEDLTGVQKSECKDNCNFRGVCHDGECFCEPRYYGKTCDEFNQRTAGSLTLTTVAMIAGICAVTSIFLTTIFLQVKEMQKRNREAEMGYRI